MWYDKPKRDLTVGDLEGMTKEEMEKAIASVPPPDYAAAWAAAREAAEHIYD